MSKKHKKAKHQCFDITEEKIKALKRSMTKEQIEELYERYLCMTWTTDDIVKDCCQNHPDYKEIVVLYYLQGGFEQMMDDVKKIFKDPDLLEKVLNPDSDYYSEHVRKIIKKYRFNEI